MRRAAVQCAMVAVATTMVERGALDARAQETPAVSAKMSETAPAAVSPGPVEREVRTGPVELLVRVAEAEISVGGRFEVELEARTDGAHDLVWPPAPTQMGELRVTSVREEMPRRGADGTLVLIRRMKLEPFLDGTYTVPAMTVTCMPLTEADEKVVTASSEEFTVRVRSNLSEAERKDAGKLDAGGVRPILPAPEEPGRGWWWVGMGGIAIGVLSVATGMWIVRRGRGAGLSVLEAALPRIRVIRAAMEADRASRSDMDELVSLARLCLVERCDARAAGMTTEELKRESVGWAALSVGAGQRLTEAIGVCDEARFGGQTSPAALRAAAIAIEEVIEGLRYSSPRVDGRDPAGTAEPHRAEEVAE